MAEPLRVLFLCTGNSARSQMAEALLRHLCNGRVEVHSAGTAPAAEVHPGAVATLRQRFGIDISGCRPKPLRDFVDEPFDFIITVCDKAAESCPVFPGDPERIHWSFTDPTGIQDPAAQDRAFDHTATGLAARLRIWMSLPGIRRRLDAVTGTYSPVGLALAVIAAGGTVLLIRIAR